MERHQIFNAASTVNQASLPTDRFPARGSKEESSYDHISLSIAPAKAPGKSWLREKLPPQPAFPPRSPVRPPSNGRIAPPKPSRQPLWGCSPLLGPPPSPAAHRPCLNSRVRPNPPNAASNKTVNHDLCP
ncbi:hypothetical protein CHARACLAT_029224 [Characodon lateralis]|uniref:Uncharacterized protein n=1 Tax=Characodon lateralis TaxID=208331 RepID=A0ABU7EXR4_9TELE|nr:hypothetical protein [Characodon lateralis]